MPRPSINFEPYRDEITERWNRGDSQEDIRTWLQNEGLKHRYTASFVRLIIANRIFSERAFKYKVKEWDLTCYIRSDNTEVMRIRLMYLYWELALDDDEILFALRADGFTIQRWKLQEIRLSMGMTCRIDRADFDESNNRLRIAIEEAFASEQISQYGREYLYRYLRSKHIPAARNRMFAIWKQVNPVGLEERQRRAYQRRVAYINPGPNFILHADGHLKLLMVGIELYAGSDGYSRFVPWCYVGVAAHHQISILKQYLEMVDTTDTLPARLRTDRGTETPLVANAHLQLHQALNPNATIDDVF